MNERELIQNIAKGAGVEEETVERIFTETIEQIVKSLKHCETVSIRNFGKFYHLHQ